MVCLRQVVISHVARVAAELTRMIVVSMVYQYNSLFARLLDAFLGVSFVLVYTGADMKPRNSDVRRWHRWSLHLGHPILG